jgi:hypothetical protein
MIDLLYPWPHVKCNRIPWCDVLFYLAPGCWVRTKPAWVGGVVWSASCHTFQSQDGRADRDIDVDIQRRWGVAHVCIRVGWQGGGLIALSVLGGVVCYHHSDSVVVWLQITRTTLLHLANVLSVAWWLMEGSTHINELRHALSACCKTGSDCLSPSLAVLQHASITYKLE